MELNADTLVAKINELKQMVDVIRGSNETPKVNVEKLVESFDEDQLTAYKKVMDLLMKADKLIHANFDSSVAQAINVELKRVAADAQARTTYVVDIDNRSKKLELDGDVVEMVSEAKKLKKQIEGLHDFLVASDVFIPISVYKHEDGKLTLTKAGNKVLDLPRIFDIGDDDSASTSKRGRPSRTKTLILGTVEDNETVWHDEDHIGKTFVKLYGTIRTDHNPVGLFKACDKANVEVTKGWDTPVEYAGKLWVAKVRD